MAITRTISFSVLLPFIGWLSGCTGVIQPSIQRDQSMVDADRKSESSTIAAKPEERQPNDAPEIRTLPDQYAREKDFVVLDPLAQAEKKPTEKSQEKKEGAEKPAPKIEEPPTTLQEAPGPKADDRLLDLWQKDLDRAMQQPPGRRKIQFSIPAVENDRVRYFVEFFSHRKKDFFERSLARSGKYIPMMATILQDEGLPEDLVYLSLIESGFSTQAVSKAKAVGPWQFIKGTGLRYGLKINGWLDERRDPIKSTRAAAAYLKDLHEQFGQWFLAAAAYNAGERKVEKAIDRSKTDNFWDLSGKKSYLKQETRNYVPKFIAASIIASAPEKFGFDHVVYESPLEYDEVTVNGPLTLDTVAQLTATTASSIKELNPALLRGITPPDDESFILKLPPGKGELFVRAYQRLPESAKIQIVTHKVKKGETLASLARRYGQKVISLMEINNLKKGSVRPGQELLILMNGAPRPR
jgi:LysM repeat protein